MHYQSPRLSPWEKATVYGGRKSEWKSGFHRVGDWFAPRGKTDAEKKASIAECKAVRAAKKAEKAAKKGERS